MVSDGRKAEVDLDRLREAYLATGSQAKAAAALGISDRTLNRHRKQDAVLARVLDEAREEFLKQRRESKPHGTRARYAAGCKCDECRRANNDKAASARAARRRLSPAQIPHGLGGYRNYGCRCEVCSEAASKAMARYREIVAEREQAERRRNGLVA